MYDLLTLFTAFLTGVIVVVGALYLRRFWIDGQSQREHVQTKRSLGQAGSVDREEITDTKAAARQNLKLLGVPDVEAGSILYGVPCLKPENEGSWSKDQPVLTVARINLLTKSGSRSMEFIELAGGYALLATGSKVALLKQYNLTQAEESYLEQQRKDAATKGDGIIEDFLGHQWTIKMAAGDSLTPGVGPKCSSIQVLSEHPRLGEDYYSVLPPETLDGASHDYYDLEAVNPDGDVLVAFYSKGGWSAFIGRFLTPDEIGSLRG